MQLPTTPGYTLFTDERGNTEAVEVIEHDGELCARVMLDQDQPRFVPVRELRGTWGKS